MHGILKATLVSFVVVTLLTALLTIGGIIYAWINPDIPPPIYLQWLIAVVLAEIIAVALLFMKHGLRYLPETRTDKSQEATLQFMEKFVLQGTSATIVSNRASWLSANGGLVAVIRSKIARGVRIEIITPQAPPESLRSQLVGAIFVVTGESGAPEARFTLINGERSGAEKLAIARGVHPEHEITIFDTNSGPQIIAMAKDIIRKSKEISNANALV